MVFAWIFSVSAIIFIFKWLGKSQFKWSPFLKPILIIILIRLILFDNIISWICYHTLLTPSDIGFRQRDTITQEFKKFLKYPASESKYLAIGSSQTGAVYGEYSKLHKDFRKIEMSGLGPLDMYLYRNYFAGYKPKYILLYLSEFDLARLPDLNLAKISASQKFSLFEIFNDLHEISIKYNTGIALKEMIAGEFFPEYKYSFIFKGLVNKLFSKDKEFESQRTEAMIEGEHLNKRINDFNAKLNKEEIDVNIKFLKKFLDFCAGKKIFVVIVEGQYHPLLYNEKTLMLNKIVHDKLKEIADNYSCVKFIPRAQTIEFTKDDYRDLYHVTGQKRNDFAGQIIEIINNPIKKK